MMNIHHVLGISEKKNWTYGIIEVLLFLNSTIAPLWLKHRDNSTIMPRQSLTV